MIVLQYMLTFTNFKKLTFLLTFLSCISAFPSRIIFLNNSKKHLLCARYYFEDFKHILILIPPKSYLVHNTFLLFKENPSEFFSLNFSSFVCPFFPFFAEKIIFLPRSTKCIRYLREKATVEKKDRTLALAVWHSGWSTGLRTRVSSIRFLIKGTKQTKKKAESWRASKLIYCSREPSLERWCPLELQGQGPEPAQWRSPEGLLAWRVPAFSQPSKCFACYPSFLHLLYPRTQPWEEVALRRSD